MAEEIEIPSLASKEEKYKSLLPQLKALIEGEPDQVAVLSNIAAALRQSMEFFWVGFYFVKGRELVLGPFQGNVACFRIGVDKGVCGHSIKEGKTVIVEDVEQFPGHIACSSESKSEIVVPVRNSSGEITMVLDVDSDSLNDFNETDQYYLEKVVGLIEHLA